MWPLKDLPYTNHLCSGNLAIKKSILIKVNNFSSQMKHGNEDVDLANKLIEEKIKIYYESNATVYHVARKGYFNFIKWNFLRGKSAGDYISSGKKSSGKIFERFASSLKILKKVTLTKPWYLPCLIFVMIHQYTFQILGAIWRKIK